MKKWLLVIIIVAVLLFSAVFVVELGIMKKYEYREVIVGFKEVPATLLSSLIAKYDGIILERNEKINTVLVKIKKGIEQTFLDKILKEPQIEYAELNSYVHAFYLPNDPKWDKQWGPQRIGCQDSWDVEIGQKSVKIAIVDTGVDYTHEDLVGNYVSGGYDWVNDDNDPMDDNSHGSHCAGIAAAVIDNNKGIAGVAQVSIMAEKVLDSGGSGSFSDVADGIVHAADNGADVISMSLGSSSPSSTIEDACKYAWDKGVILVGASGNDYDSHVSYPAAYDSVIAVGALDQSDKRTSWSNYGEDLELMAPGDTIISTLPDDNYEFYSGTSMACPHVAGVAALALSRHPDYTNQQIRDLLVNTADDLGNTGWDEEYGYGRVDSTFNDEVPITRPVLNVDIHKLTRIDPIDPGDDKPEWYYMVNVESDNTTESQYNYNGYNEKILFWWRFVWNSEYTWEVDKTHIFNVSGLIVTLKIKLMEHDPIPPDDVADISSDAARRIAQFKYDLKNDTLIEDESDGVEPDDSWYVANGELDGSTDIDENDAKLWFSLSDNYNALVVELKNQYFGRKNEKITMTGSASSGLPPYTYSWDMDNDGLYDDGYGKIIKWSWGAVGTYIVRLKVVDSFNQSEIKETTVYIDDSPPIVEITKPKENSLYIFNRQILPLPLRTRIMGSIDIEADAADNVGVSRLEFYIDNKLKTTLTEKPYNWTWDEKTPLRFRHRIKAVAYDNVGNSASDEIVVWKLF